MIRYHPFRLGSGARDPRAPFLVALLAMAAFASPSSSSPVGGQANGESYGVDNMRMLPPLVHLQDGGNAEGTTYHKFISAKDKNEPEKYQYKNEEGKEKELQVKPSGNNVKVMVSPGNDPNSQSMDKDQKKTRQHAAMRTPGRPQPGNCLAET